MNKIKRDRPETSETSDGLRVWKTPRMTVLQLGLATQAGKDLNRKAHEDVYYKIGS